jgi:hypothetical protein
VNHLAVDPTVPDTVYAATATKVFRSTDGGLTWEPVGSGLDDVPSITGLVVDPADPTVLYVSTEGAGVMTLAQE